MFTHYTHLLLVAWNGYKHVWDKMTLYPCDFKPDPLFLAIAYWQAKLYTQVEHNVVIGICLFYIRYHPHLCMACNGKAVSEIVHFFFSSVVCWRLKMMGCFHTTHIRMIWMGPKNDICKIKGNSFNDLQSRVFFFFIFFTGIVFFLVGATQLHIG